MSVKDARETIESTAPGIGLFVGGVSAIMFFIAMTDYWLNMVMHAGDLLLYREPVAQNEVSAKSYFEDGASASLDELFVGLTIRYSSPVVSVSSLGAVGSGGHTTATG